MSVSPSRSGTVFDIREFTLHDGPGMRTTVFLKGCPLACTWCHNPEGMSRRPQLMRSAAGERVAGRRYDAAELAALLLRQADILGTSGGGVTFSGGEPLAQAPFVAGVIDRLPGVHIILDTSGYGGRRAFLSLAERSDLVLFDVKLVDPVAHARWTGRDNRPILRNLSLLAKVGRPFVVRVPLVPGVTDTRKNLAAIAETVSGLAGLAGLARVELLPYNRAAGGKYAACGMTFAPGFDESRAVNADTSPFARLGVEVRVA